MASVPFKTLLQQTDDYTGKTVILGGYILETKNLTAQTTIRVLQTPLGFGEEPKSKDKSEGRFLVLQEGFLDPEVYAKDRKITVAGKVLASNTETVGEQTLPYLEIESLEIYLWPKVEYYLWTPPYDPLYYLYYPYPYHPYRCYPYL